jgi:hypothetical protein
MAISEEQLRDDRTMLTALEGALGEYARLLRSELDRDRGRAEGINRNPIDDIKRQALHNRLSDIERTSEWLRHFVKRTGTVQHPPAQTSTEGEVDAWMEAHALVEHIDGAKNAVRKLRTQIERRGKTAHDQRSAEHMIAFETMDFLLNRLSSPRL